MTQTYMRWNHNGERLDHALSLYQSEVETIESSVDANDQVMVF